mmetsp:Transcript_90726/g.292864  ORF Transcript_90726/g.292864 Transcript_90726/m.292864 type:complete len:240 (-) Transcript_90726:3243-3962(-)
MGTQEKPNCWQPLANFGKSVLRELSGSNTFRQATLVFGFQSVNKERNSLMTVSDSGSNSFSDTWPELMGSNSPHNLVMPLTPRCLQASAKSTRAMMLLWSLSRRFIHAANKLPYFSMSFLLNPSTVEMALSRSAASSSNFWASLLLVGDDGDDGDDGACDDSGACPEEAAPGDIGDEGLGGASGGVGFKTQTPLSSMGKKKPFSSRSQSPIGSPCTMTFQGALSSGLSLALSSKFCDFR